MIRSITSVRTKYGHRLYAICDKSPKGQIIEFCDHDHDGVMIGKWKEVELSERQGLESIHGTDKIYEGGKTFEETMEINDEEYRGVI